MIKYLKWMAIVAFVVLNGWQLWLHKGYIPWHF